METNSNSNSNNQSNPTPPEKKTTTQLLQEWKETSIGYGRIGFRVQEFGNVQRRYDGKGFLRILPTYSKNLVKHVDPTTGRNYVRVGNGQQLKVYVDELVATCFCYRPAGCYLVRHKNGDLQNDLRFNLEWVDAKTYRSYCKPVIRNGVEYRWWKRDPEDIYVSETGSMLIEGQVYDKVQHTISDRDTGTICEVHGYIEYNRDRLDVEDAIRETWGKEVVHEDGNFGNWNPSNLRLVDPNSKEAQDLPGKWVDWANEEDAKRYRNMYHEPMPDCLRRHKPTI